MSLDKLEKINYNFPPSSPESVFSTNEDLSPPCQQDQTQEPPKLKRPRTDDYGDIGLYTQPTKLNNYICSDTRSYSRFRSFLTIRHNNSVYHTEDWKHKGCTRYVPLLDDIMINTQNIEQISFEYDQFFLADEKGNYVGAKPGNAIHLWRFDCPSRKLYISRSILFLKEQDFQDVQVQLAYL